MASKILVVLGATGVQGGSVINSFLHDPNWHVRAVTRDPAKPASAALAAKGVEVVRGDANDSASLHAAFTSAHAIFAVTDFWGNTVAAQRLQSQSGNPDPQPSFLERAAELELRQAQNIFDAAAQVEGLERLVWSSLPFVSERSKGKYTRMYPFDAKARADRYLFSTHPELGKKTSIVQVGVYVENYLNYAFFMPHKDPDGSFVFRFPRSPDTSMPFIIASTQTGHFVKPLITSAAAGLNVVAASTNIPVAQFPELWGKTLGVNARYEEITVEEFIRDIPPPLDGQLADMAGYFQDYGYSGQEGFVAPETIGIQLPSIKEIQEWIKGADWSNVFSGKRESPYGV